MQMLTIATDPWSAGFLLMIGTLVSEDLTCITAGVLISQSALNPMVGVLGCLFGIFIGDLGLWGIGRFVALGLSRHRWIASRILPQRLVIAGALVR
jgi:membrane protein DedA with SNARE-associated domain